MHLAVKVINIPEIKIYNKFNFEYIDKAYMYGHIIIYMKENYNCNN